MIPIVFYLAPETVKPVAVEKPQHAVVVYETAPRPFAGLFRPRPQVYVIQSQCSGEKCQK